MAWDKSLLFVGDFTYRKRPCRVAVETAVSGTHVDADDFALAKLPIGRNAVNHDVVYRNASRCGKTVKMFEIGCAAAFAYKVFDNRVKFFCGNARLHVFFYHLKRIARNFARNAHFYKVGFAFYGNHIIFSKPPKFRRKRLQFFAYR